MCTKLLDVKFVTNKSRIKFTVFSVLEKSESDSQSYLRESLGTLVPTLNKRKKLNETSNGRIS